MRRRRLYFAIPVIGALAVAIGSLSVRAQARGLDIYFIDVEGGAATLTITPSGESILVDCGWPKLNGRDPKRIESVARYAAGLGRIDHYVTTHWHTDHYGGVADLARLIPIGRYWDRGIPAQATDGATDFGELIAAYRTATGGKSTTVVPGDRLALRPTGVPVEMQVVAGQGKVMGEGDSPLPVTCSRHGAAPAADESDNMLSLALLLKFGRFRMLNCGDLTWAIEHKLVCPKNRIGKVDLWQVTHHGWHASGNPALVEATKPRVAMMVNGARKGASPSVVRMCKSAPSIEALYQLHMALGNNPDDNTSPERIANLDEKCSGEYFRVRVAPDGESYTVYKGNSRPLQTFMTR